jgi:serine kinase of HPr protein (carbohydrate metabolism regulator)
VRWLERGLLIEGPSGGGKSDLVTRLLAEGARLVADDIVRIERRRDALFAGAERLPGHVELRGAGIYVMAARQRTPLHCLVRVSEQGGGERLPAAERVAFLDLELPVIPLDVKLPSAVARLRTMLIAARFDPAT